jgi:hypothetical protein
MRRREFNAGLGGVVARPLAPRAQQGERTRRVGVLMGFSETDRPIMIRLRRRSLNETES